MAKRYTSGYASSMFSDWLKPYMQEYQRKKEKEEYEAPLGERNIGILNAVLASANTIKNINDTIETNKVLSGNYQVKQPDAFDDFAVSDFPVKQMPEAILRKGKRAIFGPGVEPIPETMKNGGKVMDRQKTSNLFQGTPDQVKNRMKKNPSFAKGMEKHYGVKFNKKSKYGISKVDKKENGGKVILRDTRNVLMPSSLEEVESKRVPGGSVARYTAMTKGGAERNLAKFIAGEGGKEQRRQIFMDVLREAIKNNPDYKDTLSLKDAKKFMKMENGGYVDSLMEQFPEMFAKQAGPEIKEITKAQSLGMKTDSALGKAQGVYGDASSVLGSVQTLDKSKDAVDKAVAIYNIAEKGEKVARVGAKMLAKKGAETAAKEGTKTVLGKIAPGVGMVTGVKKIADSKTAAGKLSGGLEVLGSAAKFVPGVGTAVGTALDLASAGVDMFSSKAGKRQGYMPNFYS